MASIPSIKYSKYPLAENYVSKIIASRRNPHWRIMHPHIRIDADLPKTEDGYKKLEIELKKS